VMDPDAEKTAEGHIDIQHTATRLLDEEPLDCPDLIVSSGRIRPCLPRDRFR
jgi:hypothetical protein